MSLVGLSAPLLVALGGDKAPLAIWAAVFFVVIQALDWKIRPGELAGRHIAKSREFHRLCSKARGMGDEELETKLDEIRDDELAEIEAIRHIAFVDVHYEQGVDDLLTDEQRKAAKGRFVKLLLF